MGYRRMTVSALLIHPVKSRRRIRRSLFKKILGQEIAVIILGGSMGQSLKDAPEVPVWLDAICLGGLN